MANLLLCQEVAKAFGAQQLFQSVSFSLDSGDRAGLIGPNGSGKSTLLKILCGLEEADSGRVSVARQVRLSYLPQQDQYQEDLNARDNLLAALKESDLDSLQQENRVKEMLSRAGIEDDPQPVRLLSGGQRKRLAVCRALLLAPEVLILDEPTNHLDIDGILWLEQLLTSPLPGGPAACLIVSHDRRFLDQCCTRIIELSSLYPQGSLQIRGNYSNFVREREVFCQQQLEQEDRLANRMRRETEWLRRGPKARATKAKYRIDEAQLLAEELSQVKRRNRALGQVQIEFAATGRKSRKLLEAKGISKSFAGCQLFGDLDLMLTPGRCLGLLGRNGCGKSTLLRLLAEAGQEDGLHPDCGEIRLATGLRLVHFDQKRNRLADDCLLRRALAPDGDAVVFRDKSVHLVSWAKKFLFRPDQLDTPVGKLSGGEKARIYIAELMRQPADVLLLDEPGNDLDIPSLEVLEESLLDFPGAVVLVSHDRALLDRLCDTVLGFDGQGGVTAYADYAQWLAVRQEARRAAQRSEEKKQLPERDRKKSKRLSYLEQREYEQIEEKIGAAEEQVQALEQEMTLAEVQTDADRLANCWQKLEAARLLVEQLYTRWHELEEKQSAP